MIQQIHLTEDLCGPTDRMSGPGSNVDTNLRYVGNAMINIPYHIRIQTEKA